MTIRLATADDLERVAAIVRNATRQMDAQGIPQWDEIYPGRAVLETDIENRHMFVSEGEEGLLGLITLNEDEPPEYGDVTWAYQGKVLVVHRLTVAPDHQGKKLASRFMAFAEDEATRRGYDSLRLDAFTANPAALALYEGRGYRRAGTARFRKGVFVCFEKSLH